MNFERIRITLIIVFFLVAIFPLAMLSMRIILQGEKLIKDKAAAHLIDLAEGNTYSLDRFMHERTTDMKVMSDFISESAIGYDQIPAQFENMKKLYKTYIGIVLTDNDYRPVVKTNGLPSDFTSYAMTTISRAKAPSTIIISDVLLMDLPHGHVPVIVICSPTHTFDGRLRHLCGIVDFTYINRMLKESEIEGTGEVYVVNRQGYFLTESRFGAKILKDKIHLFPTGDIRAAKEINDYRGHRVLHVQRYSRKYSWYVVAEQDTKETLAKIEKLRRETLVYVLFITLGVLVLSVIVSTVIINIMRAKYKYEKELEFQVIQKDKLAALGLMTAGLAHELNTPLANALLYTQIAQEELSENNAVAADNRLSTIQDEVRHCSEIVKNLLDFSHHTIDDSKHTNVNEVISKLLTIAGPHCESNGIIIHKYLEKNIPSVRADTSIIQEIITNIFANAIDSTPDGGEIRITTNYFPVIEKIRIDIADSGIGIPREALGKIFDPFFTTKKPGEGTGLGLFICYQMVRRLGGDIRVLSSCDTNSSTGTTFTVELPADKDRNNESL